MSSSPGREDVERRSARPGRAAPERRGAPSASPRRCRGGGRRGRASRRGEPARPRAGRRGRRGVGRRGARRPPPRRARRQTASIPGEESMPITSTPACATGTATRAGPDAELDDRPARLARLLDVEADVLDDAPAPLVVEPCDGVVLAQDRATRSAARPSGAAGRSSRLVWSVFAIRPRMSANREAGPGLLGDDERPALARLEPVDVNRPDPHRLPGPGDLTGRVDLPERWRRSCPARPSSGRSSPARSLRRGATLFTSGFQLGQPLDVRDEAPDGLGRRGDLDLGPGDGGCDLGRRPRPRAYSSGFRAIQTNSVASSSNGCRSKER